MKLTKSGLLSVFAMLACSLSPLFADLDLSAKETDEEVDFKALRQFIENRDISIRPKGGQLKIAGDVRASYRSVHQVLDGQRVEGSGRGGDFGVYSDEKKQDSAIPAYYGNIEATLGLDYKSSKTFAGILLKFNNHMGLDTTNFKDGDDFTDGYRTLSYKSAYAPSDSKIQLVRAYLGYDLWEQDGHKLVGTVGRQRLYDLFDSRVMFVQRCDGLALSYTGAYEGIGNVEASYSGWIVADRVNHFAHAAQVTVNQILDSPLSLHYGLINWARNGEYSDGSIGGKSDRNDERNRPYQVNRDGVGSGNKRYKYMNEAFRYTVSQIGGSYELPAEWYQGQKVKVYASYLYNHRARSMKPFYLDGESSRHNRHAAYAGVTIGKIQKPGDFFFDACYQYVGAQAVPEFDSYNGAGRGNLTNTPAVLDHSQGNTNYKGVRAQLAYLITPDLVVNLKAVHTSAADRRLTSRNNLVRSAKGEALRFARNSWDSLECEFVYSI